MGKKAVDTVGSNGQLGVVIIVGMDSDTVREGGETRRYTKMATNHSGWPAA